MTRFVLGLFLAIPCALFAQKQIYIPQEWQQPNGLDYSLDRSAQSDNFIVFWGPLAGADPTQAPSDIDFDPQNILNTAEDLYEFYIDGLHFVPDDSGLLSEYKIILVMLHTWTGVEGWAFGGNYDGTVGAMWMHPDAASSGPTLAHEFTHTLQNYAWMMYPGHGFINHSYVGSFWETHAEFMALQRYNSVALEFDMARWLNTNQFHWSSTRHHYQAFIFLQYIKELDGLEMINRLWRESNIGEHPLETYKRLKGISQSELNDLFGHYAMRNVVWDYEIGDLLRERVSTLPDIFVAHATIEPEAVDTTSGWYRISDHLAPQDYGYNIIRLFPEADTACADRSIHLKFRGHANVDEAAAGWRYGLVAVKNGSEARYSALYSEADEIAFTMQAEETELYLVVTGAPAVHHNYDWEIGFPKIYRFPYEFRLENAKPDGFQPGYRAAPNVAGAPHPNGGGFVAATAIVAPTAYVGPQAQVLDNAQVFNNARIEDHAIVRHSARIRENATISGRAIVGGDAWVFGTAKVHEQARVYGNSAIQGNAVLEGNAMIHFTQVADDAVLGDNVFCYNANLHGDVRLGGDAEFFSECSDGTYLQFVEAYGRNCDGLDDHPANVEINTPYTALTAAAMQYDYELNCSSLVAIVDTEINAHICEGDTYDLNGEVFSSSGQYQVVFTDVNGGDSLVILNLTVHSTTVINLSTTICNGDAYEVGEEVFTQAGTYQVVLTSSFGCDSVVVLTLGVNPVSEIINLQIAICNGESYVFDGDTLTQSGFYQATFGGPTGCGLVNLNLIISSNSGSMTELEASFCGGDTYDFNGELLTEGGVYTLVLTNASGCDSTITLTLTELEPSLTLLEETICGGQSFVFDGETLTESGAYTAIYSGVGSCDSIVILNLEVQPILESAFELSICEGESYDFYGDTLTESGVYTTVLPALNGCDSTITLTLTTIAPALLLLEEHICNGESYAFNGEALTETGAYTAVYTQANGCDSIVVLNLTVLPVSGTTTNATICPGEAYVFNGEVFTATGVYVSVFTNAVGCDSTTVLNLTVSAVLDTTILASICEGEVYTFNGQDLAEGGTYDATFTNPDGCHSTITLILTLNTPGFSELEAAICEGEVLMFNGEELTESGVYTAILASSAGCDSTVTLTLNILPTVFTSVEASICESETYLFNGEELTESGTYTAGLTAVTGCDSIVTLMLDVLEPAFSVEQQDNTLTVSADGATFQWIDCATGEAIEDALANVFVPSITGSYAVVVTQEGCAVTSECFAVTVVSTDDPSSDMRWTIMPNPTSGLAQLRTEIAAPDALDLQVFDMAGRLCLEQRIPSGELAATIDLSKLSDGVFLVRLTTGQSTRYLQRLVKVTR